MKSYVTVVRNSKYVWPLVKNLLEVLQIWQRETTIEQQILMSYVCVWKSAAEVRTVQDATLTFQLHNVKTMCLNVSLLAHVITYILQVDA